MEKKVRKSVIFFDDLKEEKQVMLIEEEMFNTLKEQYIVRSIKIDEEQYGYDGPDIDGTEQHVHAKLVKFGDTTRKSHQWLLVWDGYDHEFTTIMKEDQNPTKH